MSEQVEKHLRRLRGEVMALCQEAEAKRVLLFGTYTSDGLYGVGLFAEGVEGEELFVLQDKIEILLNERVLVVGSAYSLPHNSSTLKY